MTPRVHQLHLLKKYKIHIASIGFAILVWFLVVTEGTYDYTVHIPIRKLQNPSHLVLSQPFPEFATIRIRGQGSALLAFLLFREAQLEPKFEWKPGAQMVPISKEDIILNGSAKSISVLQLIDPLEQSIVIEKLEQKKVPAGNRIVLQTLPGYTVVGEISIKPESLLIRGPVSTLHKVDTIYTAAAVMEKLKRPVHGELDIDVGSFDDLVVSPSRITFSADVQKLMEKRISQIPVHVINTPAEFSAFAIPASLSLVAEGGVQSVANLTEKQINAYIDFPRSLDRLSADFPAFIDPLPGIRFRAIEPKRFKVILERKK